MLRLSLDYFVDRLLRPVVPIAIVLFSAVALGMAGLYWQEELHLNRNMGGCLIVLGLVGLGVHIYRLSEAANEQRSHNQALVSEIARRRNAEERLQYEAQHDPLTSLANRGMILNHIDRSIQLAKRENDHLFAVLFMDIDNFKLVNDSLGHAAGDRLLFEVGRRLSVCVRGTDTVSRCPDGVASRVGGDEFVILLDGINDQEDVVAVAERVRDQLRRPYDLGGHERATSVSIGITTNRLSESDSAGMLRDADTALLHAKARGKACWAFFEPTMRLQAIDRLEIESALREAVSRRELELAFQPILSTAEGGIEGFEALLRWRHPRWGHMGPTRFIPAAEETGLIIPIGEWVLREACRQAQQWIAKFPDRKHFSMHVNVSGRQLAAEGFANRVDQILEGTGLDPRFLIMEVTESVAIQPSAMAAIRQLLNRGLKIYMDDFGTGYSSLSCLHTLPLHGVKLDYSYINRLGNDQKHVTNVQAVVVLAHNQDLRVVAEGVETVEQLDLLRETGCDCVQGFYFSEPIHAHVAERLLAEDEWSVMEGNSSDDFAALSKGAIESVST
jgi:diguanylate cyclase (GGDEF)-like protein